MCYRNPVFTYVLQEPSVHIFVTRVQYSHVLQEPRVHMCYKSPVFTYVLQEPSIHTCYKGPVAEIKAYIKFGSTS